MPLRPRERQPISETSTNVDVKALKDKRKKFLVFQQKWLENERVHKQRRKELKIVQQQERQAKFHKENDLWPKQIAHKILEQEEEQLKEQLVRDIDELVQQSEEVRATF